MCLQGKRLRPSMLSASSDQRQSLPESTAAVVSAGETGKETEQDRTERQAN